MPYVSGDEATNAPLVEIGDALAAQREAGARLPLFGSDRVRVVVLRLPPGTEPHNPHRHPHADEVMVVLEGRGLFTIGDAPSFSAGPRSVVSVPRDITHRIQVPGPEPLLWLSIVAPNEAAPDETVDGAP